MLTVRSVSAMLRLARRWQREGVRVGLVPTMGCLHDGHLSLVRRARRAVGPRGKVVVSIYVNPTQFGPGEDLTRYPRNLARDSRLCRAAGVDIIFAPSDREMYPHDPSGAFSTFVAEESLSRSMEGASRPTHFRGVTTVVAKLFNIVQPAVAVFGTKDYQQAAIIRRMVRDLNFPLKLIIAPTLREPDGLAISSRNQYLRGPSRSQATALWRCLQEARAIVRRSKPSVSARQLETQLRTLLRREPGVRLDYIAFFDPLTLAPAKKVTPGTRMAIAAFVGPTRLIDNVSL